MSKTIKNIAFLSAVIIISFAASSVVLSWNEPSVAPPGGNVSAPLNTGSTNQSKEGWLGIGGVFVPSISLEVRSTSGLGGLITTGGALLNTGGASNGLIVQNGNVGIGTTGPTAKLYVKTTDLTTVPFQTEASLRSLSGWSYRKPITISNLGSVLTNYQVLVTLNTQSLITAVKMKADCGDIRFTDSDGSTLLNYWQESGCNTATTKLWVKIPSIPASQTKTIYLYYGNSGAATLSSIDNTMETGLRAFYHDGTNFNTYEGTCVDSAAPNYNWGSGIVSIAGCPNDQADTASIVWEGWVINRGSGIHTFYVTSDDGQKLFVPTGNLIVNNWVDQGATEKSATYSFSAPVTIKYLYYENGSGAVAKLGWAPADGSGKVYPIPSTYVRTRKYASPDPSATVGGEETPQQTVFYIQNETGNVGIGTMSPRVKLDVRGDIKLDSDGSLFASGGVENLRIIRGTVRNNDTIHAGSGFTVTNISAGIDQVNFDTAFSGRPTVVATQQYPGDDDFSGGSGWATDNCVIVAVSTTRFRIKCGDSLGFASDRWYEFIAIGPR